MSDELPRILRTLAAVDGERLALALIAASDRPDWVDQITREAPAELLRDALRRLTVDVVGAVLGGGRP